MEPISSASINRWISESGRSAWKNSVSRSASDACFVDDDGLDEVGDPFRTRWPPQHRVYRDAGAAGLFGEAAGDRQLRRLGHAVMDHLGGWQQAAFAGDEGHPAPVLGQYAGELMPRQPDAAEDIDIEEAVPFGVLDLDERLGRVMPRLLTRMSTVGAAAINVAAPSAAAASSLSWLRPDSISRNAGADPILTPALSTGSSASATSIAMHTSLLIAARKYCAPSRSKCRSVTARAVIRRHRP
jgi:hypothetical protein